MLDRCDRVQLAVGDAAAAARRFGALLGAEIARVEPSRALAARRTVLALGESEIELCEPDGAGPAADFLSAHGEGPIGAGYSAPDLAGLARRLDGLGVACVRDGAQIRPDPAAIFGFPVVLSPSAARPRIGPVSFLYETTHVLGTDWRRVAAAHAGLFGLDPTRFSAIGSARFGYEGTLTLFDPPNRLDRIELSQATDPAGAMGRFVRRRGDALYMAYVETHDWPAIRGRLDAAGARWTPRGRDPARELDGGWIHPRELHGLLLGVSRTGLAWEWSGRKDLVPPAPAA